MQNIKRKGFTLLEILLVIAAIGILAAIVLIAVNPNKQINQARQVAINSEKNVIEKALQQRLIDTGNYPAGLDGLQRRVCSNAVTIDCIDLSGLIPDYIAAIPESITYTVAIGNDGRAYVNTTETAANLSCPTGYIPVPGNSLYNTKDFCVMKYEAKAVDVGNPTVGLTTPNTGFNTIDNWEIEDNNIDISIASVANGYPIANIEQATAAQYCTSVGASLITNPEWMTIARNIEAQPSNWTGGTVGSGGLWIGHSDDIPNEALEASTDDNLGYEGTGNINETPVSIERRTHTLSNGQTIWDLSGNINEWTNDIILGENKPNDISDPFFGENLQQWTVFNIGGIGINYGVLGYDLLRPSNNNWNSTQNTGSYNPGDSTGGPYAFHRGGTCDVGGPEPVEPSTGIFALDLSHSPSYGADDLGFRCVVGSNHPRETYVEPPGDPNVD